MYLSPKNRKTKPGIIDKIVIAATVFHGEVVDLQKSLKSACVKGMALKCVKIVANKNSLQEKMNTKNAVTAIPDFIIGIRIFVI